MASLNTRWIIVGAGFAGAATAWALARAGLGPGLILEQEPTFGVHASGRNAALVKLSESDTVVATLARRTRESFRNFASTGDQLVRPTGGLTLAGESNAHRLEAVHHALVSHGLHSRLLSADSARKELPLLNGIIFTHALWCADEGVADIHAILGRYIRDAREGTFRLQTNTRAEALILEGGRVVGVRTTRHEEIRGDAVIDASGAWAGRLAGASAPLPLKPLRRHLFVSARVDEVRPDMPFVWLEDAGLYFRPEGDGLLLSPCDETPMPPGVPPIDAAAAELLAEKLARFAPPLADLAIRRQWACLRTFAPDRRPVIGYDSLVPGLFHVSGLGGFGMMCSAAIGELAASLLVDRPVAWIDTALVAAARAHADDSSEM